MQVTKNDLADGAENFVTQLNYNKQCRRLDLSGLDRKYLDYIASNIENIKYLNVPRLPMFSKQNSELRFLYVRPESKLYVGDETCRTFCKALTNILNLTTLNFRNIDFNDKFYYVLDWMKNNDTLSYLMLDLVVLSEDDLISLFDVIQVKAIKTLSLSNMVIPDKAVEHLEALLIKTNTLTYLKLTSNCLGHADFKKFTNGIRHNKSLKNLEVTGQLQFQDCLDDFLLAISKNKTIKILSLEGAAEKLNLHPNNLEHLDFRKFRISNFSILNINKSLDVNKLTYLDLPNNKINDDNIEQMHDSLCKNTSLIRLNLRYNSITKNGADKIANMLKINETLRHLVLQGNPINCTGVESLFAAIPINNSLVRFDISRNKTSPFTAGQFSKFIQNCTLERLGVTGIWNIDENYSEVIRSIAYNTTLIHLDLNIPFSKGDLDEIFLTNFTLTSFLPVEVGDPRLERNKFYKTQRRFVGTKVAPLEL